MDIYSLDSKLEFLSKNAIIKRHDEQFDNETLFLEKLGFTEIEVNNMNQACRITPKGMMFFYEGGFKTFEDNNKFQKEDIETRIKLNKWLFRCKWLPYAISTVSIIISIIALFVKCNK